MSRVFSFRDLQRLDEFKGMSEITMLGVDNDETIGKYLAALGFDLTKPVLYVPAKHRDLSGKVAVGFRAVGDIDPYNRSYIRSSMCDTVERLIAASKYDMSLTKELCKLMGSTVEINDDMATEDDDGFPEELIEEDFKANAAEISNLEAIRDIIRGSPYNEAGALKTFAEYRDA